SRVLYRHALLEAADFEGDGGHGDALGGRQHYALLLVGSEPGHRDLQVVRARKEVGEHEQPLGVRDGLTRDGGRGVAHRDRGARNGALAAIDYRAANLAAQALGVRRTRRADRQAQSQESEDPYETMHVSSSA